MEHALLGRQDLPSLISRRLSRAPLVLTPSRTVVTIGLTVRTHIGDSIAEGTGIIRGPDEMREAGEMIQRFR